MEEERFKKYLIIIGSLVIFGGVFWVLYSFLTASPGRKEPYQAEAVVIQWEVLEMPALNQLSQFSKIVFPSETLGRDNPLSGAIEGAAE